MNELKPHPLLRVLKAATVLAAVYGAGVAILLGLFISLGLSDVYVEEVVAPFAILFGFALIVFALARRIGFALLWLVLIGLWIWMLLRPDMSGDHFAYGVGHPYRFVTWSALAFPLFTMTLLAGVSGGLIKVWRWSVSRASVVVVLWIILVIAGVMLRDYASSEFPWTSLSSAYILAGLGWVLWAPMPMVIAWVAVRWFWTASQPGEPARAAA